MWIWCLFYFNFSALYQSWYRRECIHPHHWLIRQHDGRGGSDQHQVQPHDPRALRSARRHRLPLEWHSAPNYYLPSCWDGRVGNSWYTKNTSSLNFYTYRGDNIVFGLCLPSRASATQQELRKVFRMEAGTKLAEAGSLEEVDFGLNIAQNQEDIPKDSLSVKSRWDKELLLWPWVLGGIQEVRWVEGAWSGQGPIGLHWEVARTRWVS